MQFHHPEETLLFRFLFTHYHNRKYRLHYNCSLIVLKVHAALSKSVTDLNQLSVFCFLIRLIFFTFTGFLTHGPFAFFIFSRTFARLIASDGSRIRLIRHTSCGRSLGIFIQLVFRSKKLYNILLLLLFRT